ncbi:UV radiation resistance protein and autophagy-related subunit 14-domain-containing protein [Trametes maxima]|nr:UV radiation resistance protein and autophagy-related subunit 14-domain-containing protein [Trametes maxima]
MPLSTTPSWTTNGADSAVYTSALPRRARHIASIQIRNLTPFPARDALASALTQPSEQPQFTPYGHLSDDLDVTVGRKRGRRFSAASSTLSSHRGDDESIHTNADHSGEPTLRRRTSSRASIPLSTSAGSSSSKVARRPSTAGTGTPARPTHRPRTLSHASSHSHQAGSSSIFSGDIGTSTSSVFPDMFRDTSQKHLEKILQSRLVETFVAITLLQAERSQDDIRPNTPMSAQEFSHSRPSTPSRLSKDLATATSPKTASTKTTPRRGTTGSSAAPAKPGVTGARHTPSASASSLRSSVNAHGKSASVSSHTNGKNAKTPSSPSLRSPMSSHFTANSALSMSHSPSAAASLKEQAGSSQSAGEVLPVPDYISPVHWPSTNPVFQVSKYEFASGTDLSTSKMQVEVWGRTGVADGQLGHSSQHSHVDAKGKGKAMPPNGHHEGSEWKVLQTWDVDLGRLAHLTEDLANHPSHLPSNTLLITLSTGETFYLPPRSLRASSPSRPPSPSAGYNSDPEVDVQRARETAEVALLSPRLDASFEGVPTSPAISEFNDGIHIRRKRAAKSATLQDILKLINLQACILDTEQSLGDVVREIDKTVVHNEAGALLREVSEREAWVLELQAERSKVKRDAQELRDRIDARREDLRRRRDLLELARQAHEQDLAEESQVEETISEERTRLASLRSLIPIIRSNLISVVSFIYPIDLVSPPDLLFTVLDVPLPIPVAATDPAPPLSLPTHKDVTEDSVATALGYSAQVIQLLAAYMGHRLVYSVTCVGSRSMIKDGISAMVGPRNFPLFSRGVDTYRFEYGVFLLNKDIEMLMAERNLRALDMRHTLPNLKNLLLTLSDNEQRSIPGHRVASSSVSISSLQSQSPVSSKSALPATQPTSEPNGDGAVKPGKAASDGPASAPAASVSTPTPMSATAATENGAAGTPSASGSTTPTKAAQRKSRAFLDLAPLTGFLSLRGRYPSSQKPSVKPVAEAPDAEVQAANSSEAAAAPANGHGSGSADAAGDADPADDEDESDRKTIRAGGTVSGEEEEVVEGKAVPPAAANGDARHRPRGAPVGREKVADEPVARSPPVVVSS